MTRRDHPHLSAVGDETIVISRADTALTQAIDAGIDVYRVVLR